MMRRMKDGRGPLAEALSALGNGLERARLRVHMTRQAVADRIHVSVQTVYNWEVGRYAPSSEHFQQLCIAYKVPPEELIRDMYRDLAQRGDVPSEETVGLEPLAARELAKLPREVQRELILRWLPLTLEMGLRIAEARGRYQAETTERGAGSDASD